MVSILFTWFYIRTLICERLAGCFSQNRQSAVHKKSFQILSFQGAFCTLYNKTKYAFCQPGIGNTS